MNNDKLGGRRHDLDALRVMSFGTLIIYHTSLLYGTKPWLLNAEESSRVIDLIAVGSHPWRMSLLFFISGLITASLLRSKSIAEIRSARTRQLLPPFVLGVLFIVPPQIYLAHFDALSNLYYWEFWTAYVLSELRLEHMWFLAYLWIYIFVWSIVFPPIQKHLPRISSVFGSSLQGVNLILVPGLFLSAIRLWLYPIFGETLVVSTDIYSHILYFSMFVAGALLMDEPRFWREIDRQRWVTLSLAVICFLAVATAVLALPREQWPHGLVVMVRIVRSVFQWCAIVSLLAFAARIAHRPNRVIAYFNKSVMTYYVVHQTVIVIAAYLLAQAGLLNSYSFIPIAAVTAIICVLIAEAQKFLVVQSLPWLSRRAALRRISAKASPPETVG
jgi:glucans biosynthesis protein C